MNIKKIFCLCLVAGEMLIGSSFAKEKCEIENCHGYDIKCGPKAAEMCTMEYVYGDRCRAYAQCIVEDGNCVRAESKKFLLCIECVKSCKEMYGRDAVGVEGCETACG